MNITWLSSSIKLSTVTENITKMEDLRTQWT